MPSPTPQDDSQPVALESPESEMLDPHTERLVYSAMALLPESGLGPNTVVAGRTPASSPRRKPAKKKGSRSINLHCHAAHCTICNHPEREAIEQSFLHWESSSLIAYEFGLGNRLAVYRHARAFGLVERRTAKTRNILGHIMEQAGTVLPTADAIIRAVRAYSCLDDNGHWTEPEKHVTITHEHRVLPPATLPASEGTHLPSSSESRVEHNESLLDTRDERNLSLTATESATS